MLEGVVLSWWISSAVFGSEDQKQICESLMIMHEAKSAMKVKWILVKEN